MERGPSSSPRSTRASPFAQPSTLLLPGAAQPPWFAASYAGPPPGSPRVVLTPLAGAGVPLPFALGEDRVPPAAAAAIAALQQRVSEVVRAVAADIQEQQEEFEDVRYELRSLARALGAISGVVRARLLVAGFGLGMVPDWGAVCREWHGCVVWAPREHKHVLGPTCGAERRWVWGVVAETVPLPFAPTPETAPACTAPLPPRLRRMPQPQHAHDDGVCHGEAFSVMFAPSLSTLVSAAVLTANANKPVVAGANHDASAQQGSRGGQRC